MRILSGKVLAFLLMLSMAVNPLQSVIAAVVATAESGTAMQQVISMQQDMKMNCAKYSEPGCSHASSSDCCSGHSCASCQCAGCVTGLVMSNTLFASSIHTTTLFSNIDGLEIDLPSALYRPPQS